MEDMIIKMMILLIGQCGLMLITCLTAISSLMSTLNKDIKDKIDEALTKIYSIQPFLIGINVLIILIMLMKHIYLSLF